MPPTGRAKDQGARTTRSRIKKAKGLTCRNCRTRKIRCDGALPNCGICRAYGEECIYDKAPPMSQILAMTERIAELERTAQQESSLSTSASTAQSNIEAIAQDQRPHVRQSSIVGNAPRRRSRAEFSDQTRDMPADTTHSIDSGALTNANAYYETTSSVHAPETLLQQEKTPDTTVSYPRSHATPVQGVALSSGTRSQVAFWEERLVEGASTLLSLPIETIRRLLHTHWTWVHPAFMFVNKETFLKDAATGGEFYSLLLLTTICLHSTRFTDHRLDEELLAKTRLLLGQAMHQESSIPLTQALLQHSAREIGKGSLSQAWLYSGMAFRMAVDLGLFTEAWADHSDMTTDQIRRNQVSRQLAWSSYLWDKIISLYYGRHPTLPEPPADIASFEALSDGDETWQPYGPEDVRGYPPVQSHKIACFANFCRLGIIIASVLSNIYGRQKTQNVVDFVRSARQQLQAWRNESPADLRIDLTDGNNFHCPPQHILTQNMLYYTTTILLYRPFRSNASCRAQCREAAEGVESLLLRMEQVFGLSRCTYVMAYCSYTAATVAVQDTKDGVPGAQRRLDTYMRALQALSQSCPGIQRSVDIISRCLASDGAGTSPLSPRDSGNNVMSASESASASAQTTSTQVDSEQYLPMTDTVAQEFQMPAFPFSYDGPLFDGHGPPITVGSQDPGIQCFSSLDSYPQQWLNMPNDMFGDLNMDYFAPDGP